ncbi:MAG: Flp pilus assembly complex ATPase component TadA [Planctomycetales bacterium]|jgi:type IV pilus assembly protein PilB|nr:Flp pilus assembly complex ATPase component TadA [Planctomycetales bacterium]MBN8624663.1 Flp pilus assembly complex ATPase component TadA [Planctomycetota bacterium]
MAFKRIGQILVERKFITRDQLETLLEEQKKRPGELLGRIAEGMNLINDEQLCEALAEQMGMQAVSLGNITIPPDVLAYVTEPMAQLYRIVPLSFRDGVLTVAMCDPQKLQILDELRNFLGYEVRGVVASERDVIAALNRYYSTAESVEDIIGDLENDSELQEALKGGERAGAYDLTKSEELADSAPVRKLLNMIMLLAIKDRASDMHFEPFEDEFKVRIKADGVLFEMVPPPKHLAFAITTRIKVMANLDIAERRLPQDGRIELTIGGHPVDLRVSVLPTMFGESVVMRVLDRSVVKLDLEAVGMTPATLAHFREVIDKPNGIVLVTGPTGSGKTTTLYSALSELNDVADKLITTEDPIEYDIDGIVQVPIDASIGNTFANCLRAILRQDPDVILVGEIRDPETAEIAVQASLTGHMVFSTLHTNDAPSSVTRLRDMGVPPFLITATVEGILAQRLVRRCCQNCKQEVKPSMDLLAELQLTPDDVQGKKFYRGVGCDTCNGTGYKGRVGLFELMVFNDDLREMVMHNASTEELRDKARSYGMVTLRDAGLEFAFQGLTTIDEVVRETVLEA